MVINMVRYGRCVSKQEAKELKQTMELCDHSGGLVPVFDSPKTIENRLRNMSHDQLRNYFRRIGVRSPQMVLFFDIDNTDGIVGPIPQTNGLREYKVSQGTKIQWYDSIRL